MELQSKDAIGTVSAVHICVNNNLEKKIQKMVLGIFNVQYKIVFATKKVNKRVVACARFMLMGFFVITIKEVSLTCR